MKKLNKKQLEKNKKFLIRENDKAKFVAKMKYLMDAYGGEGTSKIIPPHILENAYSYRISPFKVTNINQPECEPKGIKQLQSAFSFLFKRTEVDLPNNNKMSLDDFLIVGISFMRVMIWIISIKEEEEWALEISNRLGEFSDMEIFMMIMSKVNKIADKIAFEISDYDKELMWFVVKIEPIEGKMTVDFTIDLDGKAQEMRYFKTDEGSRPAYCVSMVKCQMGMLEATIKPSLMGVKNKNADIPVKVYYQNHAKLRLKERIDCLAMKDILIMLYTSLLKPVVIPTGKNRALIEYRLLSSKVGYLVAEYIDGAVLIHTFLFITSNGTPEGKKLYELTGLGKLDKKYLALDKLSSFIKSDIANNEKLNSILVNSQCECLLQIEDSVQRLATKQADNSNIERILNYLKKDTETIEIDDESTMHCIPG